MRTVPPQLRRSRSTPTRPTRQLSRPTPRRSRSDCARQPRARPTPVVAWRRPPSCCRTPAWTGAHVARAWASAWSCRAVGDPMTDLLHRAHRRDADGRLGRPHGVAARRRALRRRRVTRRLVDGGLVASLAVGGVALAAAREPADHYRTALATTASVEQTIDAVGTVASAARADASFSVGGTVGTVDVAVGDTVAAGALLATLDASGLEDALEQAESELADAEQTLEDDLESQTATTTSSSSADTAGRTLTCRRRSPCRRTSCSSWSRSATPGRPRGSAPRRPARTPPAPGRPRARSRPTWRAGRRPRPCRQRRRRPCRRSRRPRRRRRRGPRRRRCRRRRWSARRMPWWRAPCGSGPPVRARRSPPRHPSSRPSTPSAPSPPRPAPTPPSVSYTHLTLPTN